VINMYKGQFFDCFSIIEDIREQGKVRHKLIDIIFIVVSAVICGCNEWKEIMLWSSAESNIAWLKKYIELPNGIPSLSTIGRLFNIISPKQFEKCFIDWMKNAVKPEDRDIVSLDGKTMRGTIEGNGTKGVHIVSALCNSHSLVIGQVKTSEKSNEITAIPELLDMLYLKGCIVTIDAMGCQRKIAEKITKDCEADYVLNVKSNQEGLLNDVVECFQNFAKDGKKENLMIAYRLTGNSGKPLGDEKLSMIKTVEKGHGRIEKRTYYYSTSIDWMIDARKEWAGLKGVGMVEREVEIAGKITRETSYYIGSIKSIKEFEKAARNHWKIESMHWSLDVTYGEDANRTRRGTAPQNMALLKRIAFNIAKKDTEKRPKESMKSKRFIAGLDFAYRDYLIDLNFKESN
jgi:predicted transposase YbfD/YdcC